MLSVRVNNAFKFEGFILLRSKNIAAGNIPLYTVHVPKWDEQASIFFGMNHKIASISEIKFSLVNIFLFIVFV